eukprot:GILK01009149.1.p1 GENE.GILK01009149.1~~GILK01009149.1.p1  ORF type:complete len:1355 (+),score=420.14 GILK01009149.1:41-4105(+)
MADVVMASDSKEFLQHFWDLADANAEIRKAATANLLKALQESDQKKMPVAPVEKKSSGLDLPGASNELTYTLKRLIRGLSSSREGARQGFALALTQLLATYTELDLTLLVQFLQSSTEPTQATKRGEKKELYLGRIFGYLSIARSGRLTTSPEDNLNSLIEIIAKNLFEIYEQKAKLRAVSMEAFMIVLSSCSRWTPPILNTINAQLEKIKPQLENNNVETLYLALCLARMYPTKTQQVPQTLVSIKNKILDPSNLDILLEVLKGSTYVHPKIHPVWMELFTAVLSTGNTVAEPASTKKKNKQQQQGVNGNAKNSGSLELFTTVWNRLVDSGLLESTHEKKFLGLQLFALLLNHPQVNSEHVPILFSKNLIRTWVNSLVNNTTFLHQESIHVLDSLTKSLPNKLGQDHTTRFQLIYELTAPRASNGKQLDRKTKKTVLDALLFNMNEDGVSQYITFLEQLFINPPVDVGESPVDSKQTSSKQKTTTENLDVDTDMDDIDDEKDEQAEGVDSMRIWVLDQLYSLSKMNKLVKSDLSLLHIAEWLFYTAFAELGGKRIKVDLIHTFTPTPALSDKTVETAAKRFFSLVSDLSHRSPMAMAKQTVAAEEKPLTAKSHKLDGRMDDGVLWATKLNRFWDELRNKGLKLADEDDWEDDDWKTRETVIKMVESLQAGENGSTVSEPAKKSSKKKESASTSKNKTLNNNDLSENQRRAFEFLLAHVALQQLEDTEEATETLKELIVCREKLRESKLQKASEKSKKPLKPLPAKKSKKAKEASESEDESEDESEPESVEVLTDILLSLLMKSSVMLREVSKQVFRAFCDDLTPAAMDNLMSIIATRENEAAAELFDMKSNQDGIDSDGSEEEEEEDAMEVDAKKKDIKMKHAAKESEDEEESGSEEEEEEDNDITASEALKMLQDDLVTGKTGETGDDGELEDQLAKMFGAKQAAKKAAKEAKTHAVHFKFRVLDLIEIYIQRQSQNPLLLTTVSPFLTGLRDCCGNSTGDKKALFERMSGVFKKLCLGKDIPKELTADNIQTTRQTAEEVLNQCCKAPMSSMLDMCRIGLYYLARTLLTVDGQEQFVSDLYLKALSDYMKRKTSKLNSKFFQDIIDRQPLIRWRLAKGLIQYSDPSESGARSDYLKQESIRLFNIVIQRTAKANLAEDDKLPALGSDLSRVIMSILNNTAEIKKKKSQKIREYLKLVLSVSRGLKDSSVPVGSLLNTKELGPLIAKLVEDSSLSNLKGIVNEILISFGQQKINDKKRKERDETPTPKTDDTGVESEPKSASKTPNKKTVQKDANTVINGSASVSPAKVKEEKKQKLKSADQKNKQTVEAGNNATVTVAGQPAAKKQKVAKK